MISSRCLFKLVALGFLYLAVAGLEGMAQEGPEAAPKPPAPPVEAPTLPDASEIMKRRELRSLAKDERAVIDIRVEEDGRFDKQRQLVRSVLRQEGSQKTLIRFVSPPTIRGLALLTLENDKAVDEQWGYNPDLRKIKRVPPSQQSETFAGTGFAYEDFRAEDLVSHEYKSLRLETVQDRPAVVIEARPKAGARRALQGYAWRHLAIDLERAVILRIEFFDASGKLLKIQENTRWAIVGGVYRPYRVKMTEPARKRITWAKFSLWAANEGLDEALFTTRALEKEGS